ncbi:hypothetical protein [Streptacidiphilus sp. MAP12-20]|uniref:hypothetical protein n=1 Tax=Streptacidiphilus sp. MAP12-20 TaxID=3156299 RepID=UPI003519BCAE
MRLGADAPRANRLDASVCECTLRISYWLAPGRRLVLMTVFRRTRMREDAEVKRARTVKQTCEASHSSPAHETCSRHACQEDP